MAKYRVVEDYQGGSFGTGRDYTAKQWLEQAVDWRDSDGWDDDERAEFIDYWNNKIKTDEWSLVEYISDMWQIGFEVLDGE